MGLFSGIGNFISFVDSFISGAISSIGSAIDGFARNVFGAIAKLAISGLDIVSTISIAAKIVHDIVDYLGIDSEEKPEVLGAKAEQKNEKNLEDFDNAVEAYIMYLKREVELDRERFDKMKSEEKIGCKVIGMALETKAVEEKIGGIDISPECLTTLTKIQTAGIKIDAKELVRIVQILKAQGVTNLNDVVELLDGKGSSNRLKTGKALVVGLENNAITKIFDLQDAVRKYEED